MYLHFMELVLNLYGKRHMHTQTHTHTHGIMCLRARMDMLCVVCIYNMIYYIYIYIYIILLYTHTNLHGDTCARGCACIYKSACVCTRAQEMPYATKCPGSVVQFWSLAKGCTVEL